ncbi:hypothetical protein GUJ93_ZPchr0010g7219 [Zizania palustris]|uniref:Uncharacterized protein n=1 Tax=Zizania palustris TaxID=103762 RepID=A0A8J6BFH0_ZIZPA|nr:hypothetical protein GUJ93_ZPchr0010g7219 [Zizania palustris]
MRHSRRRHRATTDILAGHQCLCLLEKTEYRLQLGSAVLMDEPPFLSAVVGRHAVVGRQSGRRKSRRHLHVTPRRWLWTRTGKSTTDVRGGAQ